MKPKSIIKLKVICLFIVLNIIGVKGNVIKVQSSKGEIILNVNYVEATLNDTLAIYIGNSLTILNGDLSNKYYKSGRNDEGFFRFVIHVEESCGYLLICKKKKLESSHTVFIEMTRPLFWEVGDSIGVDLSLAESASLSVSEAICSFTGIGAEKYNVVSELKQLRVDSKGTLTKPKYQFNWSGNLLENDDFDRIVPIQKIKLKWLDEYKNKVSALSYDVIKAEILYNHSDYLNYVVAFVKAGGIIELDSVSRRSLIERFNSSHDYPNNYGISQAGLGNSIPYIIFMIKKYNAASYLYTGGYSLDWIYENIKKSNNSPEIKEILIMNCLWTAHSSKNYNKLYADARKYIENKGYLKLYKELRSRLSGGAVSDDRLEDYYGKVKSLADFKNKVVLVDFWFTGCPACADYYKNVLSKVKRNLVDYENVVFASISVDEKKNIWKGSVESGAYTSTQAVNLYTNGLGGRHPIIAKYRVPGFPCVMLVDKMGYVKYFNSANLYNELTLTNSIKELLDAHSTD